MPATKPLLSIATAAFLASFAASTEACEHRTGRVSYYVKPAPARVSYTSRVVYQPETVVKPVAYHTVSVVKKVEPIVVPVPAPNVVSLTEIEVDSTVTASLNFLGSEQGHVFLQLGTASLECKVVQWSTGSVTFKTPNLGLQEATAAELEVVRPDGRIVRGFKITLAPKANLLVHATTAPAIQVAVEEEATTVESAPLVEAPAAPIAEVSTTVIR